MAITINTPVVVNAAAVDPIDVTRLSDVLGMVCYEDSGDLKAATVTIASPLVPNAEITIDPTSGGDEARLVGLSATTAMIIYDTGATTTEARILSVSGTTITKNASTVLTPVPGSSSSKFACKISSTKVLFVWTDTSGATKTQGVILSVAGTVITENAISDIVTASTTGNKCYAFSDTRALVTWVDAGTGPDSEGSILTLSGNTIFAVGAKKNISTNISTNDDHVYMVGLSTTKAVWGGIETIVPQVENFVLTLNGTTFDIGTELDISLTDQNNVNASKLSSTALIIVGEDPNNTFYANRYNVTGASSDELIADGSDTETITGVSTIRASEGDQGVSILAYEWNSTDDGVILIDGGGIAPDEYTLAAMRKPADLDESGSNIYVSALNASGTPVLIEFSTNLNADGSIVFNPGAGDNIGVECGRFNANVIWVAGNFDGTNAVEKSEDGGSTFVVKDDGTISNAKTFVMGPDSDDRLLVTDGGDGDILETTDSGESWTLINTTEPKANAIARLGENVQEVVFGNDGAPNDSIDYSVNSGVDLEDYQTGVYPATDATGVIVN